jgi:hypothetical protein
MAGNLNATMNFGSDVTFAMRKLVSTETRRARFAPQPDIRIANVGCGPIGARTESVG